MGNCYSAIQLTIMLKTIYIQTYHATLKNHNRSTAFERSVIDNWGGGGGGLKTFGPHEGFLTHEPTKGPNRSRIRPMMSKIR